MTVLAAFAVLLGRYAGQDDVVVGTPVANRNRAETEGLIGFFVNTLVLRTDLSGDPTFAELLGRVRGDGAGRVRPPGPAVRAAGRRAGAERDRSRTPLFQVLFNYVTGDRRPTATPGGPGRRRAPGARRRSAKFDLTADRGRGWRRGLAGAVEYSTALFDAATVGRLAGHLGVLLAAVAADAGRGRCPGCRC